MADLGEAVVLIIFEEPGFVALSLACLAGLLAVLSMGCRWVEAGAAEVVEQVNTKHSSMIDPVFLFINYQVERIKKYSDFSL